jgi:UDPglucose 6-dehydrogenase
VIGFAGLTHLGVVSSVATATKGYEVLAYDPDPAVCGGLSHGPLPIWEPELAGLLAGSRSLIRFTFDPADLSQCALIFISQDVSTDNDNRSNLADLHRLVDDVVGHASPGTVLVVLSQVPPGFTRRLAENLEHLCGAGHFPVFYQVETLILGRAVERALYPERIIVGCSHPAAELPALYADLLSCFDCPILLMGYESAELAKASVNMFLASSICVANTLAELCEAIGADWSEIIPALQLDKRIGPNAYLVPGLGLAGGNLERDLATIRGLANELGTDAGVVDACLANSGHRRDWALKTFHAHVLSRLDDPTIAIWGLAYKPDTRSTKNSPAKALLEALRPFAVRAYDPQVVLDSTGPPNVVQSETALDACRGADALAIMTPWREFSSIDLGQVREVMAGSIIVDPFGALETARCIALGFSHFRLGLPAKKPESAK